MKKKLLYFLSFSLPIIIFMIVAGLNGFLPFGNKLFNMFDAYTQYPGFMAEFGDMLRMGRSLLYSFKLGMGVDFFGIICYYLINPFNLLLAFFKNEKIFLFYTAMIYLKIGLSGLSMYIYLNSKDNVYKDTFINLLFAIIYALSGYAVVFCYHLQWMDAYILLPLIIMGLDKLILRDKNNLYIILLGLCIILNYYMAYKVCIFLVIYFVYKSLITNNFTYKKIVKFLGASLIAALLASIVLVPTIFNLLGGRFLSLKSFDYTYFNHFTFFTIPYNLTVGAFMNVDNWSGGSNIIYASVFVLALIVYFFKIKNISKKEKIITGCIFLFFVVSFSFLLIDYGWNMFQRPLGWAHRYQFVFVFFLILIGYEALVKMDLQALSKRSKAFVNILFIMIICFSFVYKYKESGMVLPNTFLMQVFFSMILFVIYINHMKAHKLVFFLVILELSLNINNVLMFSTVKYDDAKEKINNSNFLVENIPDKNNFRMIMLGEFINYGLMYDYNSIEIFSSSHNIRTLNFMQKTGISEYYMNTAEVDEINPAVLSLLGLKYYVSKDNLGYFECTDNICIDKYAMPYMYGVNKDLKSVFLSDDYVLNINNIYSALMGENIKVMNYLDKKNVKVKKMKVKDDGTLYEINDDASVSISYQAQKREMIIFNSGLMENIDKKVVLNGKEIEVPEYKKIVLNKGDNIDIVINYSTAVENKLDKYLFSLLDLDLYEKAIKMLNSNAIYQNKNDHNYILSGIVNSDSDTLMLTIPYTEGLKVMVDGKKVDIYPLIETFVGLDVSPGKHKITVEYSSKGLNIGLAITLITFLCMSIRILISKRNFVKN